jgi:hypothetical protein
MIHGDVLKVELPVAQVEIRGDGTAHWHLTPAQADELVRLLQAALTGTPRWPIVLRTPEQRDDEG